MEYRGFSEQRLKEYRRSWIEKHLEQSSKRTWDTGVNLWSLTVVIYGLLGTGKEGRGLHVRRVV